MELEIRKQNWGFTLIELIIALAVFGSLVISMTSVVTSILKAQRKTLAIQRTQESIRYMMETVTKEVRMSTVETGTGSDLDLLKVTNPDGETFDYYFDELNKNFLRQAQVMSPSDIDISGAFYITKTAPTNQVLVTIVMQVSTTGDKTEARSAVNLQSTVSCRGYE